MSTIATQVARVTLQCGSCEVVYHVVPSRATRSKFCSKSCAGKGSPWTEERKKKIGIKTSGPRPSIRGALNYNWKGGSSNSVRRLVLERDQQTCQCTSSCGWHLGKMCGFSDAYIMHVDHVQPKKLYPELRFTLENLLTVCPNCHQRKTNAERRDKIFHK